MSVDAGPNERAKPLNLWEKGREIIDALLVVSRNVNSSFTPVGPPLSQQHPSGSGDAWKAAQICGYSYGCRFCLLTVFGSRSSLIFLSSPEWTPKFEILVRKMGKKKEIHVSRAVKVLKKCMINNYLVN